jgi:hypothetical protein
LTQNAKCEVGVATASHTFAALLVDEDFVLMTATNKTRWRNGPIERRKSPQSGT